MRYRHILLEYDRSKTYANFHDQIIQRMTPHDWREVAAHWPGPLTVDDFIQGLKYPEYAPGRRKFAVNHILDLCEQADPSTKKKFTPQILRWYIMGRGITYIEDIYKAEEPLRIYMKFKNRIHGLDLSKITFREFDDLMDEQAKTPSGPDEEKAMTAGYFERGEAELCLDDGDIRVISPKTEDAAQYFGRNTKWCTSAKSNNLFKKYNRVGPLYIILFKSLNKRWQVHFGSGQYMDEKDDDILFLLRDEIPKHPALMRWWDNANRLEMQMPKHEMGLSNQANLVRHMFHPTVEDLKTAITKFPLIRGWFFKDGTNAWNLTPFTDEQKAEIDQFAEDYRLGKIAA